MNLNEINAIFNRMYRSQSIRVDVLKEKNEVNLKEELILNELKTLLKSLKNLKELYSKI